MLSLRPPFLLVGDLMIFRDDKDEEVFYFACQQPSICVNEDGTPAISAYAITPESGVGVKTESVLEAGLSIDVELAASEEDLAEAKEAVQKQFGVRPRLFSPAPIHSGLVHFTMAQSGEDPEKTNWFVSDGIKPSLTGNNKVSLIAHTTGEDAKLMISAIDAGSVPASVYYELTLIGITPIYHASLRADMAQIYHHFEQSQKDNFLFYSEEISRVIDELKDSKALEISVEELDPEIKAEAESALFNNLTSKVIDEFFQPVEFPSDKKDDSVLGKIGNAISNLVTSIIPGRRYIRKTVDRIQQKEFTIDLSQSNAKLYTYCPQALLKTMADSAGINLSEVISWIHLDNLANTSQEVSVRVATDAFDSVNLKGIEVFCRVIDSDSDAVVVPEMALPPFEKGGESATRFNYIRQRGVNYHYEYRVNLLMHSDSEKVPELLSVPWTRADSPYIYINPTDFYKEFDIDIYLEDKSIFDHAQMVRMTVEAVTGSDVEPVYTHALILKPDENAQRHHFSVVAGRDAGLRYNIHLTYYLQGAQELELDFKDVADPLFLIPNPFENKWSVDLRCMADWDKYEIIYLRTRVHDPDQKEPIVQRLEFTKERTEHVLNVSCGLNTPESVFEYLIQALPAGGTSLVEAGWFTNPGRPIMIIQAKEEILPTRIIRARLAEPFDFEKWEAKAIEVSLRFDKKDIESQRFTSENQDKVMEFVHVCPEGESREFEFRYAVKCSGTPKSPWEKTTEDDITILIDKDLL